MKKSCYFTVDWKWEKWEWKWSLGQLYQSMGSWHYFAIKKKNFAFIGAGWGVVDCDWRKCFFKIEVGFHFCSHDLSFWQNKLCHQRQTKKMVVFVTKRFVQNEGARFALKTFLTIFIILFLYVDIDTLLLSTKHSISKENSDNMLFLFLCLFKIKNPLGHTSRKISLFSIKKHCAPDWCRCFEGPDSRFCRDIEKSSSTCCFVSLACLCNVKETFEQKANSQAPKISQVWMNLREVSRLSSSSQFSPLKQ